jgi:GT2 family glycosyltransferase
VTSNNGKPCLSVSVVIHQLDEDVLGSTLQSLLTAVRTARSLGQIAQGHLYLVDNSESVGNQVALQRLASQLADCNPELDARVISGHGNVGYGRGHNLAMQAADQQPNSSQGEHYHLVLNPDVIMQPDAIAEGLGWLSAHPDTVAVAPTIDDGRGDRASACKRYPTVFDFLLRGFAPVFVRRRFAGRLARYEMRDLPADRPTENIPIISGCFMLFRQAALRQLNGFDPAYFLYFEDFDLSLRTHQLGSLTYLPSMHITHLGGHSAKKGLRHIAMFARSALRFFSTHGWRLV